ncbi:hypothetical protein ACIRU5_19010 [Streptomyces misionensis]|uniref:hypothetical protein n=1 Tax=Streptomyces misionensis TaxID=67331 RepID=UPI00380BCA9C
MGVGALTAVPSLLLVIGGRTEHTAAGERGQPAGVLGETGLFQGGKLPAAGLLARSIAAPAGRR